MLSSTSYSEETSARTGNERSGAKRTGTVQTLAAALALANVYLLTTWNELGDRSFDYYRGIPYQTWPVFGRAAISLLVLAFLFWILITAAGRLRRPALRKAGFFLLLAFFLVGLDILRTAGLHLYGGSLPGLISNVGSIAGALLTALLLYLALTRKQALLRGIRFFLLLLFPLLLINLAMAARAVHTAASGHQFAARTPAPPLTTSPVAPRFIWVIFDEWGQYLSFVNRPSGLALPELDRFRSQSLHAENAYPPAIDTQESLPSLIVGRIVQKTQRFRPDDLLLTFADSGEKAAWSSLPNVFQKARQSGINTALVGFYHPYPRILGENLTESYSLSALALHHEPVYWSGNYGFQNPSVSIEESLLRIPLIARHFPALSHRRDKRTYRILYLELRDRALKMAVRPDLGLTMLHLPIPHPPGIYDRERSEVTAESDTDYLDNLALLDLTLRKLRRAMESQGQWDNSFILLTSDHPLRGWEGKEYEIGIPSPRRPQIPFLLKVPGQKKGIAYTQPFNTVLTQELVLATLRGELRRVEDIATWLDRARLRYPTVPILRKPARPSTKKPDFTPPSASAR